MGYLVLTSSRGILVDQRLTTPFYQFIPEVCFFFHYDISYHYLLRIAIWEQTPHFRVRLRILAGVMDDSIGFDFLQLLEENEIEQGNVATDKFESAIAAIDSGDVVAEVASLDGLQHQSRLGADKTDFQKPSVVGKCGGGRHGNKMEVDFLALHMRHVKSLGKTNAFKHEMASILHGSSFSKNGKSMALQCKATSSGLVLHLISKSKKGNRFRRALPWGTFFQVAYHCLNRTSHIALCMDISRATVRFMVAYTCAVYMSQQKLLLFRLVQAAATSTPAVCIRQLKWDETSLMCGVDADQSGKRVLSAWEVMVAKQRLTLIWPNGDCLAFRLVMPPAVLLSTGAHSMYYALTYHLAYAAMNKALDQLASLCGERVFIYECDGAYANERLVGHLLHKNKHSDLKYLMLSMKCQNHQTQLINVSLLTCIGNNILNRMYGMTVFIRNLGYWLRLRKALYDWVNDHLDFQPYVMSSSLRTVYPHAACSQLVDYLRDNRKVESEDSSTTSNFEKRAEAFLDMWNGDISSNRPIHICSHECILKDQRHCQDRKTAVRKMVDTLQDLFMSSMPSVPAPNKWTTLFGPLDFCLAGFLIHGWLTTVFKSAFADLKFSEYDPEFGCTDPKLVETLCFHTAAWRNCSNILFLPLAFE